MRTMLTAALVLVFATLAQAQEVTNFDFSEWSGDKPASWTVRNNKQKLSQATGIGHETAGTALQVELIKDGGGSYGEILQKLKLDPYTRYRISGDIRSSKAGLGIYQVKVIRDKKELERLNSERSSTEWKTVAIEFDSVGADEVQILCRYNQKGENTGESIWWTNLVIEKLGDGAPPIDPMHLNIADAGSDQYVTPGGAGDRRGSSWDNARAADDLQAAIDDAGPGNAVHLGSGEYPRASLRLAAGGSGDDARVTIKGIDTGGGLPRFVSDFDKARPAETGGTFLTLDAYVGFVSIENIRLDHFMVGVLMYGPNRGVRVTNVDSNECREGLIVNGGAVPNALDSGTHDLIVKDCDITHYTKRGIRIRGGVHSTQIINCHADSGGKEWAVEAFPMGFTLEGSKAEGVKDHDITYVGCTARGNWHLNGKKYWNGDGFSSERNTFNITYRDCGAFDNTDGGWDIKSENPVLINCVAMRNKRNFRFWSRTEPAQLTNCLSAYATHYGGSGGASGLWVRENGRVRVERSTFHNNAGLALEAEAGANVQLTGCILSNNTGAEHLVAAGAADIVREDTVEYLPGGKGEDPRFIQGDNRDWDGQGDDFNSATYGPGKGYRWQSASEQQAAAMQATP